MLSPSRSIYKFSPGVPVEPVGHQVLRDTNGWESGGQVREQGEQWKTCSLRPWKASQASRAQVCPAVNTTKAQCISPCLLNQSLQNTRWGESQTDLKHHLVQHTLQAMRKLRPRETMSLGPKLVGLLDTFDLLLPSRFTFLFFFSKQSLFQHSVWSFRWNFTDLAERPGPKEPQRLAKRSAHSAVITATVDIIVTLPPPPPAPPPPPWAAIITFFVEKSLLIVNNITITV